MKQPPTSLAVEQDTRKHSQPSIRQVEPLKPTALDAPNPRNHSTASEVLVSSIPTPNHNSTSTRPLSATPNRSQHLQTEGSTPQTSEWDGWPDGNFMRLFSLRDVTDTKNIQLHWSTMTQGYSQGSVDSETWLGGRKAVKSCWGVILCRNESCVARHRPKTKRPQLSAQLNGTCFCGGQLEHITCQAKMIIHTFKHGKHFEHRGFHHHARPANRLHTTTAEDSEFAEIVKHHPKAGPTMLQAGVEILGGRTKPAPDISPLFINPNRVQYERRLHLIREAHGQYGGSFVARWKEFCEKHDEYIVHSNFGEITVISMKSDILAGEFVKDIDPDEPVNGIVSDAAHGYWREGNSLLIISSTYSPLLNAWVPGVFSYSNGASAQHYALHFFALFMTIDNAAKRRGTDLVDRFFAGVGGIEFSSKTY